MKESIVNVFTKKETKIKETKNNSSHWYKEKDNANVFFAILWWIVQVVIIHEKQ
jgi:hypothetical protein